MGEGTFMHTNHINHENFKAYTEAFARSIADDDDDQALDAMIEAWDSFKAAVGPKLAKATFWLWAKDQPVRIDCDPDG